VDEQPPDELTADSLILACGETLGLIEAVCKTCPVKSIAELTAFLDATRHSPVHARMLLDLLKPKQAMRR